VKWSKTGYFHEPHDYSPSWGGEYLLKILAYAISVHKAQGSEFSAVVLPTVTGHYLML